MSEAESFGRCMCGEVRYRITGSVADTFYCHCESCRRSAGAPVVAWGRVNEKQFSITRGELSKFNSSPSVTRSRCAKCGAELCYQHKDHKPDLDFLLVTLDSANDIPPTYHVRTAEKLPWIDLKDGLPRYEGWRQRPDPHEARASSSCHLGLTGDPRSSVDVVNQERILEFEKLIRPYIRRTPALEIEGRDVGLVMSSLTLKLELFQHSGSFKARGAFANLLGRDVPPPGVVAASGGNHGAAVAYAAMKLGVPAKIFVPSVSSLAKVQRIRAYGADLMIEGDRYADALAASEVCARQTNAMSVHAFDQDETMLGQGTLGMELEEQVPHIDTLLVSVGGGGLIGGVAAWFAGRIKVIGVEPMASPTLTRALEAGRPVDSEAGGLASDSLAPRRVGDRVFPIAKAYVHSTVLVADDAIAKAQQVLWEVMRIVAEPGGTAAFAALLSAAYVPKADERVGVVISGGNTVAVNFDRAA